MEMEERERLAFRNAVRTAFKARYHINDEDDVHIQDMADTVTRYFMVDKMANDDDIEPDLRGIFYLLEDMDLLKMDITEKHLIDGRVWRKHYWIVNENRVGKIAEYASRRNKVANPVDPAALYKNLPEFVWNQRPGNENN
jgi:hypothetical protein